MLALVKDMQVGLRSLRKTPLVTGVAILTLALGIGANSAIFSIVNTVLLQPLPIAHPDRIVFLSENSRQRSLRNPISPANYLDWKAQNHTLKGMSAFSFIAFTYSQSGGAVRVNGADCDHDLFEVAGIKPIAGRTFVPDDDHPGADNVVVVSESFWKNSLGGRHEAIGQSIRLNSRPYTVIGVVPDSARLAFGFGDLWKPLGWSAAIAHDRTSQSYTAVGRLRDGITLSAAQSEFQAISQNLAQQYPATNTDWVAALSPLVTGLVGNGQRQLLLLLGVVAVVLLIACVNLASLFSARMNARRREIATRLALGASRGRLVRQFLVESVLLSICGGICAIGVAYRGLPLLIRILPANVPRLGDAKLDVTTLAFTLVLSIVAGILFGLAPGLQAARAQVHNELQDSSRGSSRGARQHRVLDGLVVAEIALSMVLLVGAGLVLRSFLALRHVDPGFRADNVLVNTLLVLPAEKYSTTASRQEFFNRLFDRIHAMPDVISAGGITALPLQGNSGSIAIRIAGDNKIERGRERGAVFNIVTDGYFETMSIPLRRGRYFNKADDSLAPRVAVINDALARTFFQDRDPIGESVYLPGRDPQPVQIIGVVGSSRQGNLRFDPAPEIFTPFRQSTRSFLYVVVRTSGNPEAVAEPIRREVAAIDPDQPVGHRTLEQQIENSVAQPRVLAELLGLFASLALILALVGVYGVTSYGVAQRTHEIGIRMALGARPRSVIGMLLGRSARLAVLGIGLGAATAAGLTSLISQFLFGIGATDPMTYVNTALLLLAIAMLASLVPAAKAARVDPAIAMRQD